MADTLPSPPESRSSTPDETANTDALTARLDGLLEQYLELLHQYTTLREELSKTFSSGFFSLAQAQRTSTLGAGRRYGEECYDERMKAQRKVTWSLDKNEGEIQCRIAKDTEPSTSKPEEEDGKETSTTPIEERKELDGDESREQQENDKKLSPDGKDVQSKAAKLKQDPAKRDPLTWFGVLVPPALRQTQAQFVKATEGQMPKLLVVTSQLKSVEQQVWVLRHELGISLEYEPHELEAEEAIEKVTQAARNTKIAESTIDSRLSRKSLTSRSTHSNSRLLKLGN